MTSKENIKVTISFNNLTFTVDGNEKGRGYYHSTKTLSGSVTVDVEEPAGMALALNRAFTEILRAELSK